MKLVLLVVFLLCRFVAFSQDTTCGIIWDEPILLSDTIHNAHLPEIVCVGDDTVHITWLSLARFGTSDLRLPYCRSVDGGTTLQRPTELLPDSIAFPGYANAPKIAAWHSNVYVFFQGSTASDTPIRMVKSTTGGSTWQNPVDISADTTGPPPFTPTVLGDTIALSYVRRGVISPRILRSTNAGLTWESIGTNLAVTYWFALTQQTSLASLHLVQRGSAGVGETEYRRSHDLGDTWMQTETISTKDSHSSLEMAIAAEDTLLVAAWRDGKYGCLGPLGCSIITRRGITRSDSTFWEPERTATETPRGYAPSASLKRERLAIGWVDERSFFTSHAGLRVSSHGDTTWCPAVDVTPTTDYAVVSVDVALSTKAIHVVWTQNVAPSPSTFRNFYRRGRFITTGVDERVEYPFTALLGQNYPNPFNASTRIPFRATGEGKVSLKIYDVLGREVAVLVEEKRDVGEHATLWNAEGLPNGVYHYRLISGSRVETRKAILLK